ncbi:NAD(P)H-binding protein [Nonomuraea sp. NPDC050790]|uniref:NAD(P)H-binding protein n=1 Tax=Nonomuraea sp. NPDC050790 TaxID=3364371 RepID=UPI00379B9588
MTVLVTGATGRVGRGVVAELLRAGARVRALTRRPDSAGLPAEVEVVGGDLENPESLTEAFDGVERMYLFPVADTARQVVAMAKRAGVKRVVVLSGALAEEEADDEEGGYRAVEVAVQKSGLEWTLVRPGEFAANWLDYAPDIRTRREVRRPFGAALTRPTHEDDIALVAARALLEEGHTGQTYVLAGPEELTVTEQVRLIGAAIGEEIRFVELTPEQARAEWYDPEQGVDHEVIDWLLDLYGDANRVPDTGAFQRLTGRPPTSFARWATDHAHDFR